MPFEEIAPGEKVQFAYINKVPCLSVKDLIKVICNPTSKNAMCPWDRLSEDQKSELLAFCKHWVFPGRGRQDPKVITFKGALKIVMWLGGEKAKEYRTKMVEILTRYFAGDPTIIRDLYLNAQSDAPLNQFARASMQAEAGENLERASKRQKVDLPTAEEMAALERYVNLTIHMDVCNRNYSGYIDVRRKEADFEFWKKDQEIKLDSLREQEKLKIERDRAQLEASKEQGRIKAEQERLKTEQEQSKLKVTTENDLLHIKRESYSLTLKENDAKRGNRKDELRHAQAMKALAEGRPSEDAQESPLPGIYNHMTTRQVYTDSKQRYSLIKPKDVDKFVWKADDLAKERFKHAFGCDPTLIKENRSLRTVGKYPDSAKSIIIGALEEVYCKTTAGPNQPTITNIFMQISRMAAGHLACPHSAPKTRV